MRDPIIRILDENTANKIAAGEVVERPASVVKELVENAIDAYSRNIEITIANGGISYIRVSDDGVGMNSQDAATCVLRHATSKIGSAEDLFSVHSLGFRGEALPSIASVSKFSLITRLHDETLATLVEVTGGVIGEVREAGGSVGTTVTVSDLFFNTPARLKFLKSPTTESGHINDIIGKLALSHPEVSFKLINNDRLVLSTSGNGDLLDAMCSIYGTKIADYVLPVNYESESFTIKGFVAKPTMLKSSRQWQTFIANSRVINSRSIAKALDNAYHSLLPKTGYPLAVLRIFIPPEMIDVNVHPQKSEIKFGDEGKLFKAVYHAITEALSTPETSAAATAVWREPQPSKSSYQHNNTGNIPVSAPIKLWKEEPATFSSVRDILRQEDTITPQLPNVLLDNETQIVENNDLIPLGQIDDCYIVASGPDGLYIIDQHAAHERIIYERLSGQNGRIPTQQLLIPLLLDFDSRETRVINDNLAVFAELGFNIESIGPNTMRLNEMPADVSPGEAKSFLGDILAMIESNKKPSATELRHACLQIAACRAAIKAGDSLNMRQLKALTEELSATALPYTCPHGRPTIIKFTPAELAKMFKRT